MKKAAYRRIAKISPAKVFLLGFVAPIMTLQPSSAEEITNVSDINECRGIKNDAERLLCFDTVADGGVFNEQQLQQVQAENFGSKEKDLDVSVDRITVTIVKVTRSGTGIHYFYTADDAVWKQSTGKKWTLKAPFEAELKSGRLGSYFLVTEGGKSVRVKRVK